MVYLTRIQSPQYHQMTVDDFLFNNDAKPVIIANRINNTRTDVYENSVPYKYNRSVSSLVRVLKEFNDRNAALRDCDRSSLYTTFYIPKKSGGLRRIDAPKPELMNALSNLKLIFEQDFHALYHTSAFAYVKGRCTVDAVKRHQANESKWFAKYDLHNFFGSTTMEFVMQQLSMIFPFNLVCSSDDSRSELETALSLAFLNGGLPQGTPISPTITNLMMIPIDYELTKSLLHFENNSFIYTRYADDAIISSKRDFNPKEIEELIKSILSKFNAPFKLNDKKTRYGSSAGSNWNLGVMLNKDNKITIGNKKKNQFKSMLHNYALDKKNGKDWDLGDVQVLNGHISYYRMVEGEAIDKIVAYMSRKCEFDILASIKDDLR